MTIEINVTVVIKVKEFKLLCSYNHHFEFIPTRATTFSSSIVNKVSNCYQDGFYLSHPKECKLIHFFHDTQNPFCKYNTDI